MSASNKNSRFLSCGMDLGSSLTKVAFYQKDGQPSFSLLKSISAAAAADYVKKSSFGSCGITGAGGSEVKDLLTVPYHTIDEISSWGLGINKLAQIEKVALNYPLLLVSVGTGTSIMFHEGRTVKRLGGTAVGGGTLLGLGRALAGNVNHEQLCKMATTGDRKQVDLLIGDVYDDGMLGIAADFTASNFGKLARLGKPKASKADLIAGLINFIGETIMLLSAEFAKSSGAKEVVFAGTTLRNNPALKQVLQKITTQINIPVKFLSRGEFAGALGALECSIERQKIAT